MKIKILALKALAVLLLLGPIACKDQLDVGNPNQPGVKIANEPDLVAFAQGGVYLTAFANANDVWLGNSYFSLPWGYSEVLADLVGASASNNQITTIGQPDYMILDNASKVPNTGSSNISILRAYNSRAATGAGNNALFYTWVSMYALNNACNNLLAKVDAVPFTSGKDTKVATIKAWAYWWKGYAYQQIGSLYYSGLLIDESDAGKVVSNVNANYVLHDAVIANSDKYFNLAITTLQGITDDATYSDILGRIIPSICQVGRGLPPDRNMWIRNINTMLARNILWNHLAPFVNKNLSATISGSSTTPMAATDWANVKTYATNGVKKGDYIFTARSTDANYIFSPGSGCVAANTANKPSSSTFKISERVIQNFKAGDLRIANNWTFTASGAYKGDYTYTTRWSPILDGGGLKDGSGTPTTVIFSKTTGAYEVVIAGSYEENQLMLAEAEIRSGNIDTGLGYVDNVRAAAGSGVAAVKGTGLTAVQAMQEVVMERRTSLIFRGISFYDSRRWGWTYDISKGGGSYGNTVVYSGALNTNVTMNYNYIDYWDVPADETVLNPPSGSSAAVQNPNF